MNSKKVIVVKTDTYLKVNRSLDIIFNALGGENNILPKNLRVLVKPNLLSAHYPQKAITTNPALVEAIVKRLIRRGNKVFIGDSPGGRISPKFVKKVFQKTGMKKVAEKTGASLVSFDKNRIDVAIPNGKYLHNVTLCEQIKNVDYIITLPKMKTHALTLITGAVKIGYGFIPGSRKGELHLRYEKSEDFSKVLIDLLEVTMPNLVIVDAVTSMQGNGPSGGENYDSKLLIGGFNPILIDYILAKTMGYKDPFFIPFLKEAKKRKLINENEIELIDCSENIYPLKDFEKLTSFRNFLPSFISKELMKYAGPRLVFYMDKCRKCNKCVRACPANALTNGQILDKRKCILCFCCQESCEFGAIETKRPILGKLLDRLWGKI